jgi:hypothetical protein
MAGFLGRSGLSIRPIYRNLSFVDGQIVLQDII